MAKPRFYLYLIILLLTIVLAFLLGNPIVSGEKALNVLLTVLLLGGWLCATIKFFSMVQTVHQFNSQHDRAAFLFLAFFVGYVMSFWGNYAAILNFSLLPHLEPWFHVSPWTVFLSLPYLIYYTVIIYKACRHYFYISFKDRAYNAKRVAAGFTATAIALEAIYAIFFYVYRPIIYLPVQPIHYVPDYARLVVTAITIIIAIRYGRRVIIPQVPATTPEPTRRTEALQTATRQQQPPARSTTSSRTERVERRETRQTPDGTTQTRTTRRKRSTVSTSSRPGTVVRRVTVGPSTVKKASDTQQSPPQAKAQPASSKTKKIDYSKYKPAGSQLTTDDFKCIFCFKLPSPDDGRSVVLCPSCRYPAHADEWKEWHMTSKLCSRCGEEISSYKRASPKEIPVSFYSKVIKKYSRG